MFKLEENGKRLNCYINGTLKYIFVRRTDKNGHWVAYKVDSDKSGLPVDSDKYRYDLAERLDESR